MSDLNKPIRMKNINEKLKKEYWWYVISLCVILIFYWNMIMPLFNRYLVFVYGDFSSIININSGLDRYNQTFYTFNQHLGTDGMANNRIFLLMTITILSKILYITDSQIHSIILLFSLMLGLFGIYKLINIFESGGKYFPLLFLLISLFYYLNLFGVERIGHIWIWFTYAIIPSFIYFGLIYIYKRDILKLIIYSLLFSLYGIIPHSFIYLFLIHMFLFIYFIVYYRSKYTFIFFFVPLFIYTFLNLPVLLTLFSTVSTYPVPITVQELIMLSRYGELINLFSFTNNWWPQVPIKYIFYNYPFRLTSIFLFVFTGLITLISLKNYRRDKIKILLLLSLIFILIIIFIAQGTNNIFLFKLILFLADHNLFSSTLLGPFREWARISLLIPSFMSLIWIIGLSRTYGKFKPILIGFLTIIIIINIITSPSIIYLRDVYSPTFLPKEYYDLASNVDSMHKVLWLYPTSAESILGTWRYVWNPSKAISSNLEFSIGSTYNQGLEFVELLKNKEAPINLLNVLNIKYIIYRKDILGASDFKVNYTYLLSDGFIYNKSSYFIIYENMNNISTFTSFSKFVVATPDGDTIYSVTFLSPIPVVFSPEMINDSDIIILNDYYDLFFWWLLASKNKTDIVVLNPNAFTHEYSPSQTWSKAFTSDPLHAEWHPILEQFHIHNWQSDFNYGLIFTWNSSATLNIPFYIEKVSKYKIFIRLFENQYGGVLRIYLDDKLVAVVNTTSQLNRFIWKDLGDYQLNPGLHHLVLENAKGFNAINLLIFIPTNKYELLINNFKNLLKNKIVAYVFEGESDLFNENGEVVNDINSSNGELLCLRPSGVAWQEFVVLKDGYYIIAAALNGSGTIKIDNYIFNVYSNKLNFTYIGPVYLSKGIHRLEIRPIANKSIYIDVIWIYSINNSSNYIITINDLFKVKDKLIDTTNYQRINPTLWEVRLTARKPFLLVFAESYDPNWEADVYKNNKYLCTVKSVPVYGIINGFWINTSGNLTIIIHYAPQSLFDFGLIISTITLSLCIFYLIWSSIRDSYLIQKFSRLRWIDRLKK